MQKFINKHIGKSGTWWFYVLRHYNFFSLFDNEIMEYNYQQTWWFPSKKWWDASDVQQRFA